MTTFEEFLTEMNLPPINHVDGKVHTSKPDSHHQSVINHLKKLGNLTHISDRHPGAGDKNISWHKGPKFNASSVLDHMKKLDPKASSDGDEIEGSHNGKNFRVSGSSDGHHVLETFTSRKK